MASEPAPLRLTFTADDVARFAQASRDHNPLHVDPEFAADTAFGACVAHGALVAVAMLGSLSHPSLQAVRSLRVLFPAPVRIEEQLEVTTREAAGGWELRGELRGAVAVRVLASQATNAPEARSPHAPARASHMREQPAPSDPARLRPGFSVAGDYEPGRELIELAARLGAGALHPALLAGLAWSSYAVGMEIPGLHSLFAGVRLSTRPAAQGGAGFALRVREHDERTGQVVLDGTLAQAGEETCQAVIECFALPPARRPDLAALLPANPAMTPRGTVAVIGASRGFGASLALALVSRGYNVQGVYKNAPARARELESLAREAGPTAGRLTLTRADAADPAAMAELAEGGEPLAGIVLNAALPPLALGLSASSAPALARYVAESVSLAAVPLGALAHHVQAGGFVLVCSSAAIQAPPRGWPHYVAAKSALEGLARWTAASRPTLRTVIARLPKMDTAMTATPSGRLGASSADLIAAAVAGRLMSLESAEPLTILDPALAPVPA